MEGEIQINQDYRLRVVVDRYTEDPLNWGWGTEIITLDGDYTTVSDGGRYSSVADTLYRKVRSGVWTEEQFIRAMSLCLYLNGDDRVCYVGKYRGYIQGDWGDYLVMWDPETEGDVFDVWCRWRRGDVYVVIAEQRATYVRKIGDEIFEDDSLEDWHEVDSLWGNYLDDTYTAQVVAEEHFESWPGEDS